MKIEYRVYRRISSGDFWEFFRSYFSKRFALRCKEYLEASGYQVMICKFAA